MTKFSDECLVVAGSELAILTELAEQAALKPKTYVNRSLEFGIRLANIALEARPFGATIMFELGAKNFSEFDIDFGPIPETSLEDELLAMASELSTQKGNRLVVPLQWKVVEPITVLAPEFDGDLQSFIFWSTYYQHMLTRSRIHDGRVLVDNNTPEGIVLHAPRFEQPGERDFDMLDDVYDISDLGFTE